MGNIFSTEIRKPLVPDLPQASHRAAAR